MAPGVDSNSTSTDRDNTLVELIGANGTAIGNVTDSIKVNVTNAAGASAVNIQDGGNSLTVDGTIAATQSGAWSTRTQDGSGNNIGSTTGSLNVNVTNSFAAGVADKSAFTYGTSIVSAVGGAFQDTSPTLTAGQQGTFRLTQSRGFHINLRNDAGTEIGTTTTPLVVAGNIASGSADSGNPVKVASIVDTGSDTFAEGQRANLQSDTSGALYINSGSRKTTYSCFASFNPAVSATDVFTITGSATKTVRVTRLMISGTNTGNTNAIFFVIKRSTANSGGVSSTVTGVPHDSNNASATATVRTYTTNPVLGTSVGNSFGGGVFLPSLASTNAADDHIIEFGTRNSQSPVLRGTSEVYAVNFNGVNMGILSATTFNIGIEWTEE